ncbi:class I lanthipeptide [Pedobacter terrae]|uniref:class I lanthipeptide n=1 Tax=Pedobacter terrae TaxID=405671 RepID=UPI002FF52E7E
MNEVKLSNKPQLEKEIIAELSENQLKEIQGGNAIACSCFADSCKGAIKVEQNDIWRLTGPTYLFINYPISSAL